MRLFLAAATLCLLSTAAGALEICTQPKEGEARSSVEKIVAACSDFIDDKSTELYARVDSRWLRSLAYRNLGDADRELVDLSYVVDHAGKAPNPMLQIDLTSQVDALKRRAEIYRSRGKADEAAADEAQAHEIEQSPFRTAD